MPRHLLHAAGGRKQPLISRADFIFTIGYDGNTAVVDGRAKRSYAGYSTEQLAEEGLFKSALCSALYEGSDDALEGVLTVYNKSADQKLRTVEHLKQTFGAFEVPDGIVKTTVC